MNSPRSVEAWLEWQASLNIKAIDLGLERVRVVLRNLQLKPISKVITVAGTNGKGSVAAFVASVLQEAGFKVGLYSSPHLVRFTERFRVNNKEISQINCLFSDAPALSRCAFRIYEIDKDYQFAVPLGGSNRERRRESITFG